MLSGSILPGYLEMLDIHLIMQRLHEFLFQLSHHTIHVLLESTDLNIRTILTDRTRPSKLFLWQHLYFVHTIVTSLPDASYALFYFKSFHWEILALAKHLDLLRLHDNYVSRMIIDTNLVMSNWNQLFLM